MYGSEHVISQKLGETVNTITENESQNLTEDLPLYGAFNLNILCGSLLTYNLAQTFCGMHQAELAAKRNQVIPIIKEEDLDINLPREQALAAAIQKKEQELVKEARKQVFNDNLPTLITISFAYLSIKLLNYLGK